MTRKGVAAPGRPQARALAVWVMALALGAALAVAGRAGARGLPVPEGSGLPCGPDGGEPVRVAAVADDLTLALADGRTVRLVGIDPVEATMRHPDLAKAAASALRGWLAGHAGVLRATADPPDRWGRTAALLFANPRPDRPEASGPAPLSPARRWSTRVWRGPARSRRRMVAGPHCWPPKPVHARPGLACGTIRTMR